MYMALFLLITSFSLSAWELADLHPAKLFNRYEPTVSKEVVKVEEPCTLTITQQNGLVKVKGWDRSAILLKISKKGSAEQLENTKSNY